MNPDTWDADPSVYDMPRVVEKKKPNPAFTHGALLHAVLTTLQQHPGVAWAAHFNSGSFIMEDAKGKKRCVRCNLMPLGRNSEGISVRFACPDILGQMRAGEILAVEVKVGRDTFRPGQQEFLAFVRENHGVAFVARSVADVTTALAASLL